MSNEVFKEALVWATFEYLCQNYDHQNDSVLEMMEGLFNAGFLKLPDSEISMNYYRHAFCDQNCNWFEHHPDCEIYSDES